MLFLFVLSLARIFCGCMEFPSRELLGFVGNMVLLCFAHCTFCWQHGVAMFCPLYFLLATWCCYVLPIALFVGNMVLLCFAHCISVHTLSYSELHSPHCAHARPQDHAGHVHGDARGGRRCGARAALLHRRLLPRGKEGQQPVHQPLRGTCQGLGTAASCSAACTACLFLVGQQP